MMTVTNLALWRGSQLILPNFSCTLEAGQGVWLCGANGAGKSSLLRALAGLLAPMAGNIICTADKIFIDTKTGFMPALTVQQNLAAWCALNNIAPQKIPAALAALQIEHLATLPVVELSTGQQQRASLARLVLSPALIWLLDEPLAHLDDAGQALLIQQLQRHLANGGIVVAATHAPLAISGFNSITLSSVVPHAA